MVLPRLCEGNTVDISGEVDVGTRTASDRHLFTPFGEQHRCLLYRTIRMREVASFEAPDVAVTVRV